MKLQAVIFDMDGVIIDSEELWFKLLTAQELEVDNKRSLVIEDSPNGVRAAKDAGMKCIGITTNASKGELKEADLLIDSFADLTVEKMMALF